MQRPRIILCFVICMLSVVTVSLPIGRIKTRTLRNSVKWEVNDTDLHNYPAPQTPSTSDAIKELPDLPLVKKQLSSENDVSQVPPPPTSSNAASELTTEPATELASLTAEPVTGLAGLTAETVESATELAGLTAETADPATELSLTVSTEPATELVGSPVTAAEPATELPSSTMIAEPVTELAGSTVTSEPPTRGMLTENEALHDYGTYEQALTDLQHKLDGAINTYTTSASNQEPTTGNPITENTVNQRSLLKNAAEEINPLPASDTTGDITPSKDESAFPPFSLQPKMRLSTANFPANEELETPTESFRQTAFTDNLESIGQTAPTDNPEILGLSPALESPESFGPTPPIDSPESYGPTPPVDSPESFGPSPPLDSPESVGQTPPIDSPESFGQTAPIDSPKSVGPMPPLGSPEKFGHTPPIDSPESVGQTLPIESLESVGPPPIDSPKSFGPTPPIDSAESFGPTPPIDSPESVGQTLPIDNPESFRQTPPIDSPESVGQTPLIDSPENFSPTPPIDSPAGHLISSTATAAAADDGTMKESSEMLNKLPKRIPEQKTAEDIRLHSVMGKAQNMPLEYDKRPGENQPKQNPENQSNDIVNYAYTKGDGSQITTRNNQKMNALLPTPFPTRDASNKNKLMSRLFPRFNQQPTKPARFNSW